MNTVANLLLPGGRAGRGEAGPGRAGGILGRITVLRPIVKDTVENSLTHSLTHSLTPSLPHSLHTHSLSSLRSVNEGGRLTQTMQCDGTSFHTQRCSEETICGPVESHIVSGESPCQRVPPPGC